MMKQSKYIISNDANCKYCYKCLRNCPVKAISFHDEKSFVIEEECVLCGTCVNVCPQHAKNYRRDLDVFDSILKKPFVLSVAPSVYAYFDNPFKVFDLFKSLGCVYISETAVGAQFVTDAYLKQLASANGPRITTSCPVIVNIVEKYFPQYLGYLMPVVSPAIAHSQFLRYKFGDLPRVFIGPCVAKKEELKEHYNLVLTFEEIEEWIQKEGIDIDDYTEKLPDAPYPERTRMYPVTGGILYSADKQRLEHVVVEGTENFIEFLEKFEPTTHDKIIIEASSCIGGCLNGPAMKKDTNILVRKNTLINYFKMLSDHAEKRINTSNYDLNLSKHFVDKNARIQVPEEQIREVLHLLGKDDKAKELNCTGCGYETCYEKARAVVLGKAEKDMCFAYLVEIVSSVSYKVVDETPNAIVIFKGERITYINTAAKALFEGYTDEKILEICKKVYSKRYKIQELYINSRKVYFYPKTFELPGDGGNVVLFVDITEMVLQRERMDEIKRKSIQKIEEVLNDQMKLAQDIAGLLGESIAETKSHFLEFKNYMEDDDANL